MQILIKPNEDGRVHNFAGKNANIDKAFLQSLTVAYESGDGRAYFLDTDKFAELIVEECVEVAASHVGELEGVYFGIPEVCYQHFGVAK
jgi:hypothetical protein